MDDQDYDDIMSEIHNMASKHGTVARVIIPKPNKDGSHVDGVGNLREFCGYNSRTQISAGY